MKDFRNVLSWRNYGRAIHRGDDKELIKYKTDTFNYISQLEAQIVDLSIRLDKLEKAVDDGR